MLICSYMFLYALYGSKNLSLKNLHYQNICIYEKSVNLNFGHYFYTLPNI